MNLNLLTIDALSATAAQPVRTGPARKAGKADGLDNADSQLAFGGVEGPAGGKRGESVLTTASARGADKSKSYNITTNTQETGQKPLNRGFKNILKRRLVSDESSDESGDGKVAAKPQNLVTSDKTGQALTAFQGAIAVSAKQKQSVTDGKATLNQPTQAVPGALTKAGNLSSAAGGNTGGVQRSVLQQTQVVSNTAQNQAGDSQAIPSTAAQTTGAQQEQRQTRGNSAAASPRLVDNTIKMNVPANTTGSGKPVKSANQNNRSGDTQLVDATGRSGVGQSKTQFAALSAVTVSDSRDVRQVESAAAKGRTGGDVTSSDHIKDKLGGGRQKGSLDLSKPVAGSRQDTGRLNEKLNIENIDLVSAKNSTPKSESGDGASQTLGGQTSALDASQAAAGSRSAVTDQSAATAADGSTSDTAAAIREQIYQSIQASIQQGNSQITIRLHPPELGRVSVKFSQLGNELTGLLEVTNSQTRAEIRQAIPEIIRSLEESGISVKHIDVTLSDSPRQPAQGSFRDNSSGDLWQQFGNQGSQNSGQNQPSHDSFVTPAYSGNVTAVGNDASLSRNQSSPPDSSDGSDNLLDVLI